MQTEIERLRAELKEFHKLKEYAKSLGQETYLELHARNERLRAAHKAILKLDGYNDLPDAWEISKQALSK